jgi:hypothetical protein
MPYKLNPFTGNFDYYEAGSGSSDLETVLGNGNTSGPNDIQFDTTQGVLFNNSSRLRVGTIDALLGGSKGIAQICAVGYELKWEAGRLYVMDGNGIYIRWSLYNFNITPTVTDDVTLGYLVGSKWSLDNGDTYTCTDNTTGAAVWESTNILYTIELMDALTVDFYAPYALKINTISNILNSPTTTILDDGAAYTLTNTIAVGSKITVTVNTAAVINLNITKA